MCLSVGREAQFSSSEMLPAVIILYIAGKVNNYQNSSTCSRLLFSKKGSECVVLLIPMKNILIIWADKGRYFWQVIFYFTALGSDLLSFSDTAYMMTRHSKAVKL